MERTSWTGALFGVSAFLVAIWVLFAWLNPISNNHYNPSKGQSSHQRADTDFMPPPRIDAERGQTKKTTDYEIEQWRASRSDLAAQWKAADMSQLAFRIGVLGVILLTWTIVETLGAGKELRRQNEIALKATKAEFQPYIKASISKNRINIVTSSVGPKVKAISVSGEILFENTGQTAANNIYIRFVARHIIPFRELPDGEISGFPVYVSKSYNQALAIQLNPHEIRKLGFSFEFPLQDGMPENTRESLSSTHITARVGFRDMFCVDDEIRATVNEFGFRFQTQETSQRYDTEGCCDDNPDEWAKLRGGFLAPMLNPHGPQDGLQTLKHQEFS